MLLKKLEKSDKIKKLAEIEKIFRGSKNNPLIIIIQQVHHNYNNKKAKKDFVKSVNELQKDIFKLLKELKQFDINILGVEDLTYPNHLEVSEKEAAQIIKNSQSKNLNTWYYEKEFPKDFKTYCVDSINICGARKAMAFAGNKLLGEKENLEKQNKYLIDFFKTQFQDLPQNEKNIIWNHIKSEKEKNKDISYLGLFLATISMRITGVVETLGELFSAVQITKYAKQQIKTKSKWENKDLTPQIIKIIQEEFLHFTRSFFDQVEKNPSYESFIKKYLDFINTIYKEALTHTKDISKILNDYRSKEIIKNSIEILNKTEEKSITIVIGQAHSQSLLNECRKKNINCLSLKPKNKIWEQIN